MDMDLSIYFVLANDAATTTVTRSLTASSASATTDDANANADADADDDDDPFSLRSNIGPILGCRLSVVRWRQVVLVSNDFKCVFSP